MPHSKLVSQVSIDYQKLMDYSYQDCINLMAVGIRLADTVHTVSPSYKKDVMLPVHLLSLLEGKDWKRS